MANRLKSFSFFRIRGIRTAFLLHLPPMIVASIKFDNIFFKASLVPLHNFEGPKLRMNIDGEATFSVKIFDGIPDGS